jgi:hypothetical protein
LTESWGKWWNRYTDAIGIIDRTLNLETALRVERREIDGRRT